MLRPVWPNETRVIMAIVIMAIPDSARACTARLWVPIPHACRAYRIKPKHIPKKPKKRDYSNGFFQMPGWYQPAKRIRLTTAVAIAATLSKIGFGINTSAIKKMTKKPRLIESKAFEFLILIGVD